MKSVYRIGCVVLSILLISPVTTWAGSCPEGQKWHDRQGECVRDKTSSSKKSTMTNYPYGGTCERISKATVERIASKVVRGSSVKFTSGQQACKRNIEVIEKEGDTILKISTGVGDGLGNGGRSASGWSDIKEGNRRRFEVGLKDSIRNGQKFSFEYSVRIASDNEFLGSGSHDDPWFYIFQLKSAAKHRMPIIVASVDLRQGIAILGTKIQDVSRFGEWVKIKIEYKPSRKETGYSRLWVDDQLVYESFDYQNVPDSEPKNVHSIKFGIYQGALRDLSWVTKDKQQSIEIKNIVFKRIP